MQRVPLLCSVSLVALAAAIPAHAANTALQWGINRSVSPGQACAYDSNNVCQGVFLLPATGGGAYVPPQNGGTGVINPSANTITLGGAVNIGSTLNTTGAFSTGGSFSTEGHFLLEGHSRQAEQLLFLGRFPLRQRSQDRQMLHSQQVGRLRRRLQIQSLYPRLLRSRRNPSLVTGRLALEM